MPMIPQTAPASTPPPRQTPSVRKRLWLGGLGLMLFLVTLVSASHVAGPRTSLVARPIGDDLIPSYMAGTFVREGRPDKLMDLESARQFQADLRRAANLEQHGRTGPWLNPPFYAWLFVPLSALPYHTALRVWFAFNLLLLGGAVALLSRMLPAEPGGGRWRRRGLVPLLVLGSMPCLQVVYSQQNTFLSLAILSAAVTFWRLGRTTTAGLVTGLLLFKPQLAAVFALVMVCSLGWRAAAGLAVTGTTFLLLTLLTLPGAIGDYLHKLPRLLPWLQPGQVYHWERQVTFQGFWRLIFHGQVSGPAPLAVRVLWPCCAAVVASALGLLVLRTREVRDVQASASGDAGVAPTSSSRDRMIAAAITAMPLLMPYYMDYDLLLLAVPAVLFAADVCRAGGPLGRLDRWTLGGWVVLFPWLFLNAAVASETRLSLSVPLLGGLSGLMIARGWRVRAGTAAEAIPMFSPSRVAA